MTAGNPPGRSVDRIDTASDPDTERTPLLAGTPTPTTTISTLSPSPADDYNHNALDDPNPNDNEPLSHLRVLLRPRVIILSLALIFFIELAIGMAIPPINAVMESIICRQMHPEVFAPPPPPPTLRNPNPGQIPPTPPSNLTSEVVMVVGGKIRHFAGGLILADDPACKGADVQGYLAMLRGWANTFESIPGIVGAVPYGILSDRWGRRPVMGLAVLGIVLSMVFNYGVCKFTCLFRTLPRLV
jgi:hypothetical protein